MKTYTIEGKTFELDDSKQYLDFFISRGMPTFAEATFSVALEAMERGEVKPADFQQDMILFDRWIKEAPRKRFFRQKKLAGEMEINAGGLVFSVDSGEYWFDGFPDDMAEEVFVALENTGHVARRFLETFLPDVAEECKQRHHPAEQYYIGPL